MRYRAMTASPPHRAVYTKKYTGFRGVDFAGDPSQVDDTRSPWAVNVISDASGFPEKRKGWSTVQDLSASGRVNGLFSFADAEGQTHFLAHVGVDLYDWSDQAAPFESYVIYTGLTDARSTSFVYGGKLYVLDGAHYLVYDGSAVHPVSEVAFVPTTSVTRQPSGGGTSFEAVNLLTPKRMNSFAGDGSSTVYHLDTQGLDSVDRVTVDNAVKTVTTDYTVNLAAGTITFMTAPPVSASGSGVDNVVILFSKTVAGYADKIQKCTIAVLFGYGNANRIFVSGNPDFKNVDYQSGLDDPGYFPDTGYTKIGSDSTAVMGYLKQYDNLLILKEDNGQDTGIFLRSAAMTEDGEVYFPLRQGVAGIGAIAKGAIGTLRDDPLFLTRQNVSAVSLAGNVTQERTVLDRSYFVNARLRKEADLPEAQAVVWNGYYILCVNGHCYVADGRQTSGYQGSFGYEWYYWTNIPARVWMEQNDQLFFGTADGRICKFSSDTTVGAYSDDGACVGGEDGACWSTPFMDGGNYMLFKNIQKRGTGILAKPYTRSSGKIYYATEREWQRRVRTYQTDYFDINDVDFNRFTFSTTDRPQVISTNTKANKVLMFQMMIQNDTLYEGFGILGAIVTYTAGNYTK